MQRKKGIKTRGNGDFKNFVSSVIIWQEDFKIMKFFSKVSLKSLSYSMQLLIHMMSH